VFSQTNKDTIFNKKELIWIDGFGDYISYLQSSNRPFFNIGSLVSWWNSFDKSKRAYALFNRNDMKPFYYDFSIKIKNKIQRVVK